MTKRERERLHRAIEDAKRALEACASALAQTQWEGYRRSMRHWDARLHDLRGRLARATIQNGGTV